MYAASFLDRRARRLADGKSELVETWHASYESCKRCSTVMGFNRATASRVLVFCLLRSILRQKRNGVCPAEPSNCTSLITVYSPGLGGLIATRGA